MYENASGGVVDEREGVEVGGVRSISCSVSLKLAVCPWVSIPRAKYRVPTRCRERREIRQKRKVVLPILAGRISNAVEGGCEFGLGGVGVGGSAYSHKVLGGCMGSTEKKIKMLSKQSRRGPNPLTFCEGSDWVISINLE